MARITGVHHIALTPTKANYKKTLDFYVDTLGCTMVRSWQDTENQYAMVSCGDNTVMEIMSKGETDNMGDGAFLHVAFTTDNLEELLEKVRAKGYEVTMEATEITIGAVPAYPVRVCFFRGPIGEHIELFVER